MVIINFKKNMKQLLKSTVCPKNVFKKIFESDSKYCWDVISIYFIAALASTALVFLEAGEQHAGGTFATDLIVVAIDVILLLGLFYLLSFMAKIIGIMFGGKQKTYKYRIAFAASLIPPIILTLLLVVLNLFGFSSVELGVFANIDYIFYTWGFVLLVIGFKMIEGYSYVKSFFQSILTIAFTFALAVVILILGATTITSIIF